MWKITKFSSQDELECAQVLRCLSEHLPLVGMVVFFLYIHILIGLMGLKCVSNADNLGKCDAWETYVLYLTLSCFQITGDILPVLESVNVETSSFITLKDSPTLPPESAIVFITLIICLLKCCFFKYI